MLRNHTDCIDGILLCRLARERARREKRQSEKMAVYSEKRSVVEDRETATMEQFQALVNVAGGKITIAKRQ